MTPLNTSIRRKAFLLMLAILLACPMLSLSAPKAMADEPAAADITAAAEAAEEDAAEAADDTADEDAGQKEGVVKKGLVEEKGALYYYKNGTPITDTWKKVNGHKYYFKANGKAAKGSLKIKDTYYIFNQDGKLCQNKSKKIVEVNGKLYCTAKGKAAEGWTVIKDNLYYVGKGGKVTTNKTIDGIKFGKDGVAKSGVRTTCMIKAVKEVAKLVKPGVTGLQSLMACWNGLSFKHYRITARPNKKSKDWMYEVALNYFTGKDVNCYGYACGFASMAKVLGYTPYVLDRGHAWVRINGRYWDTIDNRRNASSGRAKEVRGCATRFGA